MEFRCRQHRRMPPPSDDVRLELFGTPCDEVHVAALEGREAISQTFRFSLSLVVAPEGKFDPETTLGAEAEVVLLRNGKEQRRVHGVVVDVVDLLQSRSAHREYRIEIRPRVERLGLVETQEIFLGLSVPEIIAQKLELAHFASGVDFRFATSGTYPPREFVVQYRESDLAFISRLAEHVGLAFFFEFHDDGKNGGRDRIVFVDQSREYPPTSDDAARFQAKGDRVDVFALQAHRSLIPSVWAVQDYNYRLPTLDVAAMKELPDANGGGVIEYSPNAKTPEEAAAFVQLRAEEREALCAYHKGESNLACFQAGWTFELAEHPSVDDGTRMLLVEVTHAVSLSVAIVGGEGKPYRNTFRSVLSSKTYRPPRRTPRPRIAGVLTAMVSPLASDEPGAIAQLDEDGRYRLRFLFDTGGDGQTARSHPIRQIQQHAGPNYGTHFPLKPGTEVEVAFLDGDPDRPIIVGAVPNPVTPSPVTRSDATKHRIKTASGVVIEMGENPKPRAPSTGA
jgi:type VI secretion system secreted protein VgrG